MMIAADESGNAEDDLRVLAGLSGRVKDLLALERELRDVLRRHRLTEVKWSSSRTRTPRLEAAREFLELAGKALQGRRLGLDLLILEKGAASKAWERLQREDRWMALYLGLVKRARGRWKGKGPGRMALYPDQRSGMPWGQLKARAGLRTVREASSQRLALIQLADLVAGLARFSRQATAGPSGKPVLRAHLNRSDLARDFAVSCLRHKRSVGVWLVRNLEGGSRGRKKIGA